MISQDFLKKCKSVYSEGDFSLIKYSLEYATKWHEGQLRASGEPYINHPLFVADILTSIKADRETIIAALLHDVVEDTEVSQEDIINIFKFDNVLIL